MPIIDRLLSLLQGQNVFSYVRCIYVNACGPKPGFVLVRQPQRPDQEQMIIAEFATKEELTLYELKPEKGEHVEVAPVLDISHMNLEQIAWLHE